MKTIKRNLEWAAKILSLLILLQSCTVYHTATASVDEAIQSNNKVKVDIEMDDPYRFKEIKVFENEYYGLVKVNSDTYKRLTNRKKMDSDSEKFKYVQVYEQELGDIHLKNKGASTALNVGIPVLVGGALIAWGVWAAGDSVSFGSY